jgi:hypothetical protein
LSLKLAKRHTFDNKHYSCLGTTACNRFDFDMVEVYNYTEAKEGSSINGRDDGIQGFTLSAFCYVSL